MHDCLWLNNAVIKVIIYIFVPDTNFFLIVYSYD